MNESTVLALQDQSEEKSLITINDLSWATKASIILNITACQKATRIIIETKGIISCVPDVVHVTCEHKDPTVALYDEFQT